MIWSSAIIAWPRREPVVFGTQQSMREAGWELPAVYAHKSTNTPGVALRCELCSQAKTPWLAFLEVAKRLLDDPAAEVLLVSQDDLQYAAGLLPWLEADSTFQTLIEDSKETGVIGLYVSVPNARHNCGWHEIAPQAVRGAPVVVLSRPLAMRLIATADDKSSGAPVDMKLGAWCRDNSLEWWAHSPSLARHWEPESGFDWETPSGRACHSFIESLPWPDASEADGKVTVRASVRGGTPRKFLLVAVVGLMARAVPVSPMHGVNELILNVDSIDPRDVPKFKQFVSRRPA